MRRNVHVGPILGFIGLDLVTYIILYMLVLPPLSPAFSTIDPVLLEASGYLLTALRIGFVGVITSRWIRRKYGLAKKSDAILSIAIAALSSWVIHFGFTFYADQQLHGFHWQWEHALSLVQWLGFGLIGVLFVSPGSPKGRSGVALRLAADSQRTVAVLFIALLFTACGNSQDIEAYEKVLMTEKSVELKSLDEAAGFKDYTFLNTSLQIPTDMEQVGPETIKEEPGEASTVAFGITGDDRASIYLTIESVTDVNSEEVALRATMARHQLSMTGVMAESEASVLRWDGLGIGAAVEGLLEVEINGEETEHDIFMTFMPAKDSIVSVSVEAPAGELDESSAMQALRTLQID